MRKLLLALATLAAGTFFAPTAHAGFFFDSNLPDVEWKTFETEHFVFHYYEKTSKKHPNTTAFTARRAAKYAEVMYPKVCEQFNHFLKEKVHVVVRDQEDISNGFAVYTEDWVTIWATPLYYPLRGRIDWIPDVMTHEFAHVVSLKANENRGIGVSFGASAGGLEEDGRNDVAYGGTIPFGEGNSAPFWWTEGGAEYWTHNVGYNHWGTSRDALLRMSMLDPDTTLTLDQLAVRGDKTGLDGERGYNHGYSIGLYLAEKYGQETYSKFAEASKKESRFQWESVIKEVLGITPDQLWQGWVEWNREKYGRVKAELEKEGMHEGTELAWTEPMWISKDEKKQKEWAGMGKRKRRWTREKNGVGRWHPRVSPTGDAYGYTDFRSGGIYLTFANPDELPAITGKWLDPEKKEEGGAPLPTEAAKPAPGKGMSADSAGELSDKEKLDRIPSIKLGGTEAADWSFSPDGTKLAVTIGRIPGCMGSYDFDGYEWQDLAIIDLTAARKWAEEKRAGKTKDAFEESCFERQRWRKQLTHEMRASSPAWSPDGEWISFVVYGDGTYNIAKIRPDGKDLTMLTKFTTGEALGEPKWSPDSKRLAFYLFKAHPHEQQDIWEMHADGTGLHALTWDKAEDKDAIYAADGKSVIYASDRTGIFNLYSVDLASGKVTQLTNSLGGAHQPALTKEGNLLYVGFNAYGFQNYAIGKKDFFNKKVEGYKLPAEKQQAEYLANVEELPEIPKARKYSAIKDMQPPVFFPIGRYEDQNVQAGGELIWWDYAGKHAVIADVLMGQNQDYVVRYINDMWYPTLAIVWARFDRSRELSFEYNPGEFGEIKLKQRVDFYLAQAFWRVGPRHEFGVTSSYRSFDVGFGADAAELGTNGPWSIATGGFGKVGISNTFENTLNVNYFTVDPNLPRGSMDINPRGMREINGTFSSIFTSLKGDDIDDGERLSEYLALTARANYAEYWAVPWLEYLEHTVQFTAQAGWISRNVQFNDEFFAGGQHPYASFSDINVNTQFAGFEPFSVIGETMLIGSVAYRMPLYRDWDKKVGPFYFDSVYLQFFGTAGNLWSFRPEPTGSALVTGQTTGNNRELPFVGLFDSGKSNDMEQKYAGVPIEGIGGTYGKANPNVFEKAFPVAYKNGNRLLTDVGVEARIRAYAYNYSQWFSFARLAYGIQDTAGIGDQNGDRIYRDLPPADDPVGEVEKAGFRFYLGIGTGW